MPHFSWKSPALRPFCLSVLVLLLAAASTISAQTVSTTVVITQVYGGGGGTGATTSYLYNQDYVELFNLSTTNQDISGWSVQYESTAGTSVSSGNILTIPASTVLAPGQYYLVAGPNASTTATFSGAPLPVTPDVTAAIGNFALAGGGGKVFLVNNSTALASSCTGSNIVDYEAVTTSTVNCYQGAGAAPAITALSASVRTSSCVNTGNNSADFSTSTSAVPHNSASTKAPCGVVAPTGPTVAVTVAPTSVAAGATALITAKITKGTSTTISTVTVDLSALGGSATQTLYDDGTHGDATAGDGTYSYTLTVLANQAANTYTLTVKATDAGSLTGTGTATLTTTAAVGTTNPTLTNGTATPTPVTAGSTTLLTVKFAAGTNPTSSGVTVTADLSAFGGSTTQAFYDDGTHGDATSADLTYSYLLTVPSGQTAQAYTVNVKVSDTQVRSGTTTIPLTVQAPVAAGATVSIVSSASTAVAGASVTFTATVAGNKASAPTGSVTFYDNGTAFIPNIPLVAGTTQSTATLTTTALTVGSHVITISYSGDTVYPSVPVSTSTSTTVVITAAPVPDFSLTVSNSNVILNDDQKVFVNKVAVSFLNGFSSAVSLTCSGLPSGSRCTFSPNSLSANGTSNMTIAIDGASLAPHSKPFGPKSETVLAFTLLALPLALRRRIRRRLGAAGTVLGLLLFGIAIVTSTTGCTGGSATPAASSNVTVTATGGSITHTATITLVTQ